MKTYHVTETKRVHRIRVLGLRTMQTSNWVNAHGERLGGGCVFSFEEKVDALQWAAKMDWGMHRATGSGKISILTLETDAAIWDPDFTDPLSQLGSVGGWLKAFQPIPAKAIVAVTPFDRDAAKEAFQKLNEVAHA